VHKEEDVLITCKGEPIRAFLLTQSILSPWHIVSVFADTSTRLPLDNEEPIVWHGPILGYPQGQPSHFRREGNISATIGLT
jgi:hypothetical protein